MIKLFLSILFVISINFYSFAEDADEDASENEFERSFYYLSNETEVKFPIYAGTGGMFINDLVMYPSPENIGCIGKDIKGNEICLQNTVARIVDKEKCLEYYYSDVFESLKMPPFDKPFQVVKKGDLIGYTLKQENTVPKIQKYKDNKNCK